MEPAAVAEYAPEAEAGGDPYPDPQRQDGNASSVLQPAYRVRIARNTIPFALQFEIAVSRFRYSL